MLCDFIENSSAKYFSMHEQTFKNLMFVSTGALCINLRGIVDTTVLTLAYNDL
jgi:hypothetical protein